MRTRAITTVAAILVVACSGASGNHGGTSPKGPSATAPPTSASLPALHATRGDHPAIVDAAGRQVVLRGVNLSSLGDYYQADLTLAPVVGVTADDWANMAAHGADVVRLLVSWSALEPSRGVFDTAYLARIHRAVDDAAAHGIYSVIDMHQDAWGKYIASPPGTACPPGRQAAIGWDGAPQWATITEGASTCNQGSREGSEAVLTAWDNFYGNRDGIMDELVRSWVKLSRELAADAAVAGYDLLNEPNHGHQVSKATAGLAAYYGKAIEAIRGDEQRPEAFHHAIFFETTVYGVPVDATFTTDTNIVFAPHNYGESIGNLPIEGLFSYFATLARRYGTAMWTGEYGWFGDPGKNAAKVARFAATSDSLLTSGEAWWQWIQACGSPLTINHPGGAPPPVLIHFQTSTCPGDHNGGVVPQWQCEWRPYPRATPGRLQHLHTDCASRLDLSGSTDRSGTLDVWFPNKGDGPPTVTGTNVTNTLVTATTGGWRITADATGAYALTALSQQH